MLSKKAKYAIKALVLLGKNFDIRPMRISEIATIENIPVNYLNGILKDLQNGSFVYSKKGSMGGYVLREAPDMITLDKIVRLLDGPIARVLCASLFHYHKCTECAEEATCSIRDLFIKMRETDYQILAGTSIADMIRTESALQVNLLDSKDIG